MVLCYDVITSGVAQGVEYLPGSLVPRRNSAIYAKCSAAELGLGTRLLTVWFVEEMAVVVLACTIFAVVAPVTLGANNGEVQPVYCVYSY